MLSQTHLERKLEECGRCDAHIGPGSDGDRANCPKCGAVEYAHTCSCGAYCWRSPFGGSFGELPHHAFGEEPGAPGWFPLPVKRESSLPDDGVCPCGQTGPGSCPEEFGRTYR